MNRILVALTFVLGLAVVVTAVDADDAGKTVAVSEVREPALAEGLEAQKGKVVLLDCWATWCVPCVKKFPHLVELHKKYAEKGLVCMSLSMDKFGDADDYKQEKVLKFLKDKSAAFPNYIVAEPKKDEDSLMKLIGDFSAIPYMVMFDRSGRRILEQRRKEAHRRTTRQAHRGETGGEAVRNQYDNRMPLKPPPLETGSDRGFYLALIALGGSYVFLVVALLIGDLLYTNPGEIRDALNDPHIRFAIRLSLLTSTTTAILAVWVAVPLGYLLSRTEFRGKAVVDTLVDIPIVLPPIVIGLSLLILFQLPPGRWVERVIPVTYHFPAIILAQFTAATAFAVRTVPRHLRPDRPAGGAGRAHAGVYAGAGVLAHHPADRPQGHPRGGDPGLGAVARRVRSGAGLRRRHARQDGGDADAGLSGTAGRPAPGGDRGVVTDGVRGGDGSPADTRPGTQEHAGGLTAPTRPVHCLI